MSRQGQSQTKDSIFLYQVSLPALTVFWLFRWPKRCEGLRPMGSRDMAVAGEEAEDQLQYHEACWVEFGTVQTWLH